MSANPETETTLVLKRTISAPRTRVFEAWTSPEMMRQWLCPDESFSVAIAEVDLRIGGSFRIGMKDSKNFIHIANGTYLEIKKPEKLVFTWSWEHEPMESVVTLTFQDLGKSTELVLKHELFRSMEQRDSHAKGWNGCLQHLENFLHQ